MDVLVDLPKLSPAEFRKFVDFIYQHCGIRVDEKKLTMLSHRIRKRVQSRGLDGFQEYFDCLTSKAGSQELEYFLDAVTTNETSFFRTDRHFEWFRQDFIPGLIKAHRRGEHAASIRVWSAACSTGEEVYTMAMCLHEHRFRLGDWEIDFLGTDISQAAISAAKAGIYKPRAVEDLDASQRRKWMDYDPESDTWSIKNELRESVRFVNHNLLDRLGERPFDCIFIRNVLIYFDVESKKRVLENLLASLAPGGFLVTGPSEGVFNLLQPLQKRASFLYQKPE